MPNATPKILVVLSLCCACFGTSCLAPLYAADDSPLPRADTAFRAGKYDIARGLYQQLYAEYGANDTTPGRRALNTYLVTQLGICCSKLRQLSEARDWFERILARYSDDREACSGAQYELGVVYSKMGLKDLAAQELEKVVTRYPEERGMCAYALLKKAKLDCRPTRYKEAIETLNKLMAGYPEKKAVCKEARWLLIEALDSSYQANGALAVLQSIYSDTETTLDEKGDALAKIANVQLRAMRYGDAKETCARLMNDYVGWKRFVVDAKVAMIQVLCEDGSDPDTAIRFIQEMRRVPWRSDRSQLAQLQLWEGGCYGIKRDYKKAEECFTRLIDTFGDQQALVGEAYFHRAALRTCDLHEFERAQSDIGRIPAAYLRHYAQGEWHYAQGQFDKAAAEFEQVMPTIPAHRVSMTEPTRALGRLSSCYEKLGNARKSQDALDRLAKLQSERDLKDEVEW